ncbi:MAG: type II toxin-antitoxin system VapC family toxin [Acidobacteriota bacterium]
MVLDTSVLIAILCDEPNAPVYEEAIELDPVRLLSTASFLEAAIVIEARYGPAGGRELDLLLHAAGVELVAVNREQAELARRAYREFGKGQHAAGLNYGDCFAYALSRASGEPLLFQGNDFSRTDVRQALGAVPGGEVHEP